MNKIQGKWMRVIFVIVFLFGYLGNGFASAGNNIVVKIPPQVADSAFSLFPFFVREHEINRFLIESGLSGDEIITIDISVNRISIFNDEVALIDYSADNQSRYLMLDKADASWRIARNVIETPMVFDYQKALKNYTVNPYSDPDSMLANFLLISKKGSIKELNALFEPPGCPEIVQLTEKERKQFADGLKVQADSTFTKKFIINNKIAIYSTGDGSRTFFCSKRGEKWYMGPEQLLQRSWETVELKGEK